jgi:hypothetical protein
LQKEKEEVLEKLWVAQSCVNVYEKDKDEILEMFEEEKVKIQKVKEQLLAE